jgi:hypothetical protein
MFALMLQTERITRLLRTRRSSAFKFGNQNILIKFCCVFSHMFQEISGIASRIRLLPISSTFFLINIMTIVHISTMHIWSYRVSGIILWIIVTLIVYKMSRNETSIRNYTGYTAVSSIWQQLWNEGWHLSPASCANAGCLKTDTPGNTSIFFCFFTCSLNNTAWTFRVTLITKLKRTVVATIVLHSASVYISR